jgi:hypothetical protein
MGQDCDISVTRLRAPADGEASIKPSSLEWMTQDGAFARRRPQRDGLNAERAEAAETWIVRCVLRGLGVASSLRPRPPLRTARAFLHHQVK